MRKALVSAVCATGLVEGLSAIPAVAVTDSGTTSVSCTSRTPKYSFITVQHNPTGNMWFKQNSTSPKSNTAVWPTRVGGASLTKRNVGDGGTVAWTSVAAGSYAFSAQRTTDGNCNGNWPGNGTYLPDIHGWVLTSA